MAARIAAWAAGLLLVALYVYATVAAVGNLAGMANLLGSAIRPFGWGVLVAGVVSPVVVLAAALLLGRRKKTGMRLLILTAGVALVAAIQIDVLYLMG